MVLIQLSFVNLWPVLHAAFNDRECVGQESHVLAEAPHSIFQCGRSPFADDTSYLGYIIPTCLTCRLPPRKLVTFSSNSVQFRSCHSLLILTECGSAFHSNRVSDSCRDRRLAS